MSFLKSLRRKPKPKLYLLPPIPATLAGTVGAIYTALTGRLCLLVEKDGSFFALKTDIQADIPPCVRETAERAAGLVEDKYAARI